jgi:hypothetical protein
VDAEGGGEEGDDEHGRSARRARASRTCQTQPLREPPGVGDRGNVPNRENQVDDEDGDKQLRGQERQQQAPGVGNHGEDDAEEERHRGQGLHDAPPGGAQRQLSKPRQEERQRCRE